MKRAVEIVAVSCEDVVAFPTQSSDSRLRKTEVQIVRIDFLLTTEVLAFLLLFGGIPDDSTRVAVATIRDCLDRTHAIIPLTPAPAPKASAGNER